MLMLRKPYLLYLGDATLKSDCKTAFGLHDWCGADVSGEWSLPAASVSVAATASISNMGPPHNWVQL